MVGICFVEASGTVAEVDAPAGATLMEAAAWNNIDGVLAECGGSAS